MRSLEMKEEARIKARKINEAGFKIKDKEEVKARKINEANKEKACAIMICNREEEKAQKAKENKAEAQEVKIKTYEVKQKQKAPETFKAEELLFTNNKDIKLLSKRQLECLSLCAHGYSNSGISKVLYISESTVKKTMEETFKKLRANER